MAMTHTHKSTNGNISAYISINGINLKEPVFNKYISSNQSASNDSTYMSLYLNEGDLLDYIFSPGIVGAWSASSISIYAMFE